LYVKSLYNCQIQKKKLTNTFFFIYKIIYVRIVSILYKMYETVKMYNYTTSVLTT